MLQMLHPGAHGSQLPQEQQLQCFELLELECSMNPLHPPPLLPPSHQPPPLPCLLQVCPPVPLKQSLAQQIHVLEEKMTEEECGNYLDAHNMGEDFCSAGY
jgi:hypothetical protein